MAAVSLRTCSRTSHPCPAARCACRSAPASQSYAATIRHHRTTSRLPAYGSACGDDTTPPATTAAQDRAQTTIPTRSDPATTSGRTNAPSTSLRAP